MRRRRQRAAAHSVSLFPFLAVLVCTLGVLIILLVVVVKAADHDVQRVRQSEIAISERRIRELQAAQDYQQIRVAGLTEIRPDSVSRLAKLRASRGHLQSEIQKLHEQAELLAAKADNLNSLESDKTYADTADRSTEQDRRIGLLEKEIELANGELERLRTTAQNTPTTYSIIPHSGPNGTTRRPIYLECNREGVIIQPFNIKLNEDEFLSPIEPGNPLDSALLAIGDYWKRLDLAGSAGNPYPLLVIRPDGASAYVLARHAIMSWNDEFGYELVEADKNLDFGSPDPELKSQLLSVIESAKIRQTHSASARRAMELLKSELAGTSREEHRPGLRASAQHGGFVDESGSTIQPERLRDENGQVAAGGDKSQSSDQSMSNHIADESAKLKGHSPRTGKLQGGPDDFGNQEGNLSNDSMPPPASKTGKRLADQRGADWALPSRAPGATAYLRPVKVFCSERELVIQAGASLNQKQTTIKFDGPTENAIQPLVDEIWKMIESWGIAGSGGYWKPELRVTVMPGGQPRMAELESLLDHSGFEVRGVQQR
jgi:hypothetical protein